MFKVVEIKNYDTHHRYGTDWHIDYHVESDKELTLDEVIEELKKLGHEPCGCVSLEENVLKTTMY